MVMISPKKIKKVKKQIRGGVESVRETVDDSFETASESVRSHPGRTAVAVLGVAIAGAAGVGAAVRHWRGANGGATLHVVSDGNGGWLIERDGAAKPVGSFDSKRKAVRAARLAASQAAPSDLLIHRGDGTVSRSHHYERS